MTTQKKSLTDLTKKRHGRKLPCSWCGVRCGSYHRTGCKAAKALRERGRGYQIENMTNQKLLDEAHGIIIQLLDIAEEFYPKYYSSDLIAEADDLLKKIDGEA